MRKYFLIAMFTVLALTIGISNFRGGSVQAKNWGFTNGDFSGTYGILWSGSVAYPTPPWSDLNGPYGVVALLTSDGQGNFTSKLVSCYSGKIIRGTGAGTYSVQPDGTLVISNTVTTAVGKTSIELTGVIFDNGKQVNLLTTKVVGAPEGFTGITATATMMKQGKAYDWSNADWAGSYAASVAGTITLPAAHPLAYLNGPLAGISRFAADGQGSYTGTFITSIGGSVSSEKGKAEFTIAPDGWLKLTFHGETLTLIYDGVIMDNGNQVFLLLTEIPGLGLPAGFTGITWTEIDSRQDSALAIRYSSY